MTPNHRGRGIFRQLFEHVRTLAAETPGVIGLRLYVEKENHSAQATYLKLGMAETSYFVLEQMLGQAQSRRIDTSRPFSVKLRRLAVGESLSRPAIEFIGGDRFELDDTLPPGEIRLTIARGIGHVGMLATL